MTVKKTDEKVEDDAKDGPKADDKVDLKDGDKGAGGDDAGGGSLEDSVRKLVSEAVDALLGDRGKNGGSTLKSDEDAMFKMVKDAQVKLKAEEEKDSKFKAVEKTVEKLTEKPPSRQGWGGRLQRMIWGEE